MTVVEMSSLFFLSVTLYCLQSIRWCSGILVGSLVGRKAGTLLRGGVSESLTQTCHSLTFGPLWFDFQVLTSPPMPPSKIGWHFLPKACVQDNTLVGREGDCVLINSFHLHVFLNLDKACAQFADLMLVFINQHWMDFVMYTKISSNYRLLSTFSTVNHVKNAQSCVNCVNAHRGTYGGTYERPALSSPTLCWSF